ncbi:lipolytic protein-like protein G-D-S-L family [Massarina eburnea CBS 473.64]|uniref:Lipolytic protein-like protein G-D-S-L family n=1 Tax=Massarina eburnea CBS 473.64 TaxID=1395130 RepID=A0A6A6S9U1_9PLEO|nr:lipolytic protein-like protein G-D-S-L family [Massarina eburnea CBS 473.64]
MISSSILTVALAALTFFTPAHTRALEAKRQDTDHWVSTWTSMPQLVESSNMPPSPFASGGVLKDATLRQTLHISIGSPKIRIAISNTFGGSDLPITAGSVGLPTGGAAGVSGIQAEPLAAITVGGKASFTVPRGQVVVTDEIAFEVKAGSVLTVSLYSQAGQSGSSITGHPGSRTTSWFVAGNKVNATSFSGTKSVHWYFVSAIHAYVPASSSALVIIGDSITDGRGSTDDANNRWTDLLHARLLSSNHTNIAVNNQAAGGNCVLSQCLGPSVMSRYKRDALEQPGVKYVMIFEGVNDIGNSGNVAQQLINAFKTIVADAKKAGLVTIGGTITPFGGSSYAGGDKENARKTVNTWIKATGNFDHVVDFAAAVENKADPSKLDSKYNGGDSLHPNVAGYQAMANAFSLDIFN